MLPYYSHLKKKFTKEEDKQIVKLVEKYGTDNWTEISEFFFNRSGRQLKDRWFNYLDPEVNKKEWTPEEEELLLQKLEEYGKKWRVISRFFRGRTDVHLKNRYRMMKRREKLTGNIRMQNGGVGVMEKEKQKEDEDKKEEKSMGFMEFASSESDELDYMWLAEYMVF